MPYDGTRETQLYNLAKAQPGYVYRRESHTYTVPRKQPRDLFQIDTIVTSHQHLFPIFPEE